MQDIRWQQRFSNFEKAYTTFLEAVKAYKADDQNILYKMALIQSFEFTFELAWKTIKDYLKEQGISLKFPVEIIKEAFSFGIIEDGILWTDMLDDRNSTVHEYNEEKSVIIINKIAQKYFNEITQVVNYFREKL
jgi:nucleotidyltransferase substrate binding protein (TIGR01987 family)